MGLWVYEADMQKSGVEIYKSEMVWPNKEHEVIYICLGEFQTTPSADKRCLLTNMTVVFTERFYKGQHYTEEGYLVKLPVRGFNSHLGAKVIENKCNVCDGACSFKSFIKWFSFVILVVSLLVMLCCLCAFIEGRGKQKTNDEENGSVAPSLPHQGRIPSFSPSIYLHDYQLMQSCFTSGIMNAESFPAHTVIWK